MENSISNKIKEEKTKYVKSVAKLDALSPLKTLARGYGIILKDGVVIKKKEQLKKEDENVKNFIESKLYLVLKSNLIKTNNNNYYIPLTCHSFLFYNIFLLPLNHNLYLLLLLLQVLQYCQYRL